MNNVTSLSSAELDKRVVKVNEDIQTIFLQRQNAAVRYKHEQMRFQCM